MECKIIARARNGFEYKFGIPRQVREKSKLITRIVFEPAYRHPEAIRGIEQFSHLWLIWGFDEVPNDKRKLTVRPPRLGGNIRQGVFATRSPYRPNPIGLTSVELLAVEKTDNEGIVLVVRGADMKDGTPIYDIKPYLPYTDCHPNAQGGWTEQTKDYNLVVQWVEKEQYRSQGCAVDEIVEILEQDPRPAYHNDEREYGIDYAGWNIRFKVMEQVVMVLQCQKAKTE